jgi:hypothetical protein
MSLPLILDITIGLIFIYLIFSLLASEIQELITTLLQWRALHLKKAIEILVAGDAEHSDNDSVIHFVNELYNHPLIKSVNQESKGILTNFPRQLMWLLSSILRQLTLSGGKKKKSCFGYVQYQKGNIKDHNSLANSIKHSAPSYITAETFATSFIQTLGMPELVNKLTESRLINFKYQQLHEIQNILLKFHTQVNSIDDHITQFSVNIYQEFTEIVENSFTEIIEDFHQEKADLVITINRMAQTLDKYIFIFEQDMPEDFFARKALQKLKFIRAYIFNDIENTIAIKGLRPNINEVVQLINRGSKVNQALLNELQNQNSQPDQTFDNLREKLPPSVINHMATLAKRAETKAQNTQSAIDIFQQELEETFNQSMERAAGVYKRNAKGVSLLIGLLMAVIANADVFNIVNRLSKDSATRIAIVNNSGQVVQNNHVNSSVDLASVKKLTQDVLAEITLPIGWTATNLKEQIDWYPSKKGNFSLWKLLTMISGWFVSGIAISMGAPFWFQVLGKVVNVRNTGKPNLSAAKK